MYEVVLEDLAMELPYSRKEETSFPQPNTSRINRLALEDIGDTAPHGAEAGDFCAVLQPLPPDSQTNSDIYGAHLILVEELIQPQLNKMLYQKFSDLFSKS